MTKEELENIDDIDMLYDLLNKAYCAETDKWKIKYANKVLEINKENPSIIKLLSYGFLEDYLDDGIEIGGYIGGTANEAAVLVDNANLLLITNSYIDFYKDVLKKDKKTKQTKTRAK